MANANRHRVPKPRLPTIDREPTAFAGPAACDFRPPRIKLSSDSSAAHASPLRSGKYHSYRAT